MLRNERSDGDGATVDRLQDRLTTENGHEKDVWLSRLWTTDRNGQCDSLKTHQPKVLPIQPMGRRTSSTLLRLSKGLKFVDVLFLINRIISEDQCLTNRAKGVFNAVEICTTLLISPGRANH